MKGKIHFVHRVDATNTGDMHCCPLEYYFDFFKNYELSKHDVRYINYEEITPDDVVILGGGGQFDNEERINRHINTLLDTGADVIAWSVGFNTHYGIKIETEVDYNRFKLITARDLNNRQGVAYLPDVSCNHPALKLKKEITRKIGIVEHKDYPIKNMSFDRITNSEVIETIIDFISETEIIISNSFHVTYWAMLMGKKVICKDEFSPKLRSFKHKPIFLSRLDDFETAIEEAQTYDGWIDECITENEAFFAQVKRIVENKLTKRSDIRRYLPLLNQKAILYSQLGESTLNKGDSFNSQLFIDSGDGFNEASKLICGTVFGDAECNITFDISQLNGIKRLRFDPIELVHRFCALEVISVSSKNGPLQYNAENAIRKGNEDVFYSSDPRYLLSGHFEEFIHIVFKIRLAERDEIEPDLMRLGARINELEEFVAYQAETVDGLNADLGSTRCRISELEEFVTYQSETVDRLNNELATEQRRKHELEEFVVYQAETVDRLNAELGTTRGRTHELESFIAYQAETVNRLGSELEATRGTLESALHLIEIMKNSTSWKMTRPFRAVSDFIKQFSIKRR